MHCGIKEAIAKQIWRQINICILTALIFDIYVLIYAPRSEAIPTNGHFLLTSITSIYKIPYCTVFFYLKADDKVQQTFWFFKSSATNTYQILQKNDEICKIRIAVSHVRYRARTCFCLSEVREYWLLIYSSNLSKSAYNFYTCT